MTRTPPPPPIKPERVVTETRVVAEPPFDDDEEDHGEDDPAPPAVLPRATVETPQHLLVPRAGQARVIAPGQVPLTRTGTPGKPPRLPYVRQEIVGPVDERSHLPARLPRSTDDPATRSSEPRGAGARSSPGIKPPPAHAPAGGSSSPGIPLPAGHARPGSSSSPGIKLPAAHAPAAATPAAAGAAIARPAPGSPSGMPPIAPPPSAIPAAAAGPDSGRVRARGTPAGDIAPGEQLRTLIFVPEPTRAAWVERELSHAPVTIQIGRRIRTIVAALVKDPPPRPQVLIVDFDAVPADELLELHEIRQEGWTGRLIGLGNVWPELRASLGIEVVFASPLVRDSLLDWLAGTRHAAVTIACPVIPPIDDPADGR